jgi:hypothetical protein
MSDTFSSKKPTYSDDEDTYHTMGGLDNLAADSGAETPDLASYLNRTIPNISFDQFTGGLEQIAQLFPGIQVKPDYQPGLTDITFTRGYYGPQQDVKPEGYGTESAGHLFWSPQRYQLPVQAVTTTTASTTTEDQQDQQDYNLDEILMQLISSGGGEEKEKKKRRRDDEGTVTSTVTGGNTVDTISGGNTVDTLTGGNTVDTISGGNVNDTVTKSANEQLVESLYKDILGRESDAEGEAYWIKEVEKGDRPFEDIVRDFIGGAQGEDITKAKTFDVGKYFDDREFKADIGTVEGGTGNDTIDGGLTNLDTIGGGNGVDTISGGEGNDTSVVTGPTEAEIEAARRKAADEQTVKNAYQQVFGRTDVDQEGLDYWTGQLASGKSSTDLLRDLVSGAQGADVQAAQNTDTVSKLYQDLLDRAPDAEGLSYFRSQLAAGATPEEVAQNIISGARAGEEASKISQAEYDRYFKQPEDTSATSQNAADSFVNSFINEDTIRKELSSQITAERVGKLRELATDYYNNNIMSANFSPEDFRDGFFYEVATTQPELISDLLGEATTSKYLAEFSAGEGVYNVGIDYNALSKDLTAALDTDTYTQYANNVDDLVESGNLANVFDAYQAEMDAAVLSEFIDVGGAELIGTLISGDNLSEVVSGAVTNYLVRTGVDMASSALASLGIPGAGPFISAALMLDGILSEALGYDSPIQDGIGWMSKQITKGVEWVENVFGDIFGSIGDFFGGLFAEGGMVRYQEGGLVDLPGEMPYSYTNYYGALGQPPQLAQPFMPQQQPMQQPQAEQNPQLSLDEVQPEMAFAGGGLIPLVGGGKIASGPGGGLDDLIPTSIDGRRAAALSDGEFVIPADVVSMMGDGSSNAGAKRLYDMVRQVRQVKTGTSKQAGPLPVGKILERTMK